MQVLKRGVAFLTVAAAFLLVAPGHEKRPPSPVMLCPDDAPELVKLSAKEVRRYVYLRTGNLLSNSGKGKIGASGMKFRVDAALSAQQYRLKGDGKVLEISGGSETGSGNPAGPGKLLGVRRPVSSSTAASVGGRR